MTERRDSVERSVTRDSVFVAWVAVLRSAIVHSWLYRWLTAEPDPDVIVIDLRETKTIGPVLALIDKIGRGLGRAAHSSLFVAGMRTLARWFRYRPVQFVSGVVGGMVLILGMLIGTGRGSTGLVILTAVLALGAVIGSRIEWSASDIVATRGYQWVAGMFEPPKSE